MERAKYNTFIVENHGSLVKKRKRGLWSSNKGRLCRLSVNTNNDSNDNDE